MFQSFEYGKNRTLSIFITRAGKPERCLYVNKQVQFLCTFCLTLLYQHASLRLLYVGELNCSVCINDSAIWLDLILNLAISFSQARFHPNQARSHLSSAISHPNSARSHPHTAISYLYSSRFHSQSARSHLNSARSIYFQPKS